MGARPLSELEGCVLGHLWKDGPQTAYAVRQSFLQSPSTHWSGSAGAVYPLLARLAAQKLVSSRAAPRGDRDARVITLAAAGRARFLEWIDQPFAAFAVCLPPDPVRTRVHFLGVLAPARRRSFLDAASEHAKWQIDALEAEPGADDFERLAIRGGLALLRAQVEWIAELRDALERTPATR